MPDPRRILVCDQCLRASCWYGKFMCDRSRAAGLVQMTAGDLAQLRLESADWWSPATLAEQYGTAEPRFKERLMLLAEARSRIDA